MKLGAVTMSYRDEGTIRGTLACLAPFVERHVVMLQQSPFYGSPEPIDNTEAICREFPNVDVIKGSWEEHGARNIGNSICSDCDWVLCFDADELMTYKDLDKLKDYLGKCSRDAVAIISKVYWKSVDTCFFPDPDHHKIIAVKPQVQFWDMACINVPYDIIQRDNDLGITHHHLSFCEPKDILKKVVHYNHAKEFDGQAWYDKHFRDWVPGQMVVQPNGTMWGSKHDPLPEELRCLIY